MINRFIEDFRLNQVEVTDAYIKNALEKEIAYLKSFDADRLVAGFRETNNMKPKAQKYDGWEVTEIRGHSLGHYMTAAAQAVAQTGDMELLEKLSYIVDELEKAQMAGGYLSAFPEVLFDNVENKKPAWVPWYTMDKIIAGLTAAYRLAGVKKALDVVSKLGDWVYDRVSKWSKELQETVLLVEYGGMNEALYDLYKITKSEKHAQAAHKFDEMYLFEELEKGNDILNGKHANTTIPKFLGAIYRYVALGYREEDDFYFRASKKFFEIVDKHHTYVTGGNSEWEHFGEPFVLDAERTNCNCETCNTYNMLKLARELFKITGDKRYADFYENTFLNAIMSSQNPKTGMTMYFQPMATGFFKVYSTPFDSFWCCTGTGMENFTKCNDSIYFHDNETVYINQFISSRLNYEEEGLCISMESKIPESDEVTIKIEKSNNNKKIAIRIPDWADGTMFMDGNKCVANTDGYVVMDAIQDKEIKLNIPMKIKAHTLHDNKHCMALKYGPVVLSGALGTQDMEESKTGVDVTIATCNIPMKDFITVNENESVDRWIENIESNVERIPGEFKFHLKNTDRDDIIFSTHYKQHEERYGIYWNMVEKDSKALQKHIKDSKEKSRLERVAIDSVPLGNDQYELLHNIKGDNTGAGTYNGLMLRHAWGENGWFSYNMKVNPELNNYLRVKYFSGNEGRTFNIYIDGEILIEETIKNKIPGEFYDEYYKIPKEMIEGKESIEVKFSVRGDSWVGGIFDKLSIVSDYDNKAEIKNISFEGAKMDKVYDEFITEYELTPEDESDRVALSFELQNNNMLVYVNDVLVEDTQKRYMDIKENKQIIVRAVAEDFITEKIYKFTVRG